MSQTQHLASSPNWSLDITTFGVDCDLSSVVEGSLDLVPGGILPSQNLVLDTAEVADELSRPSLTVVGEQGCGELSKEGIAVNSPVVSISVYGQGVPEVPKSPSTDILGKEGREECAALAVNFPCVDIGGLSLFSPTDNQLSNVDTVVKRSEVTPELSAKSKEMKTQGKLSSAAELIPQPVHERKRPAMYDDFETKFVRTISALRPNTGKLTDTANRYARIIWKGALKRREWKTRDHEKYGGGKCRTGKHGTKWQGWKRQDHRLWKAKHHVIHYRQYETTLQCN